MKQKAVEQEGMEVVKDEVGEAEKSAGSDEKNVGSDEKSVGSEQNVGSDEKNVGSEKKNVGSDESLPLPPMSSYSWQQVLLTKQSLA